jgi:hypothetical protein
MTKESYKKQLGFLEEQITQLKKDYVSDNRLCDIDAIVEVKRRNGEIDKAVVTGFKIGWTLDVEPILRKLKKDGTMSEMRVRVWSDDKVVYPAKATQ